MSADSFRDFLQSMYVNQTNELSENVRFLLRYFLRIDLLAASGIGKEKGVKRLKFA
jgi:hypothetical protein